MDANVESLQKRLLVGLYEDVRRRNPLTDIPEMMTNENHVTPQSVEQDIHSVFLSFRDSSDIREVSSNFGVV